MKIIMILDETVAWYQKKIGTYDKQEWEKTVEQKILNSFVNVPLKNTTLKTDLIDVDLVRGSSFPKAKPKQSLITVLRLAVLRFLFLPLYAKWWVNQTSPKVFGFLLFTYLLQMFNFAVYSYNINRLNSDTDHIVSIAELLIPVALSLVLSVIHSQIVATASNANKTDSRRQSQVQPKRKKRERIKRRKKNVKIKSSPESKTSANLDQVKTNNCNYSKSSFYKNYSNTSTPILSNSQIVCDENLHDLNCNESPIKSKILDSKNNSNTEFSEQNLRKRNVNWDSPIKSHVLLFPLNSEDHDHHDFSEELKINHSKTKTKRIENSIENIVNEYYNDLLDAVENNENDEHFFEQTGGDDDGFESLNGKSSSGEENFLTNNRKIDLDVSQNSNFMTDSDTDTLKGQSCPTKLNRKNSLTLTSNLNSPTNSLNFKKNLKHFILASNNSSSHQKSYVNSLSKDDSSDIDEENEDCETVSTPGTNSNPPFTEAPTSAGEWIGVTTNSDECSYSSDFQSDTQNDFSEDALEYDFTPTVILNPACGANDRISCTIWDRMETKKAEMSVLDISSAIIEKVEAMPETCDYVYIGVLFSILLSFIPAFCRLCEATLDSSSPLEINIFDMPVILLEKASFSYAQILLFAFGDKHWERFVLVVSMLLRICLTFLFFFLLAVAERTFKQRFLYAKLFSHLTSSRRARKSELPHFRLNKVRNIKTWLSVRSYLKRRGPQRSVEVIVSAAFILTLMLLGFLSVEWLKDSVHLHSQINLEALLWSCALGIFLLRFMTLGTKINRKYRSISVLITEQINLYLQIEQKPNKKDELMVSNSVLKLAADLLKELESPFKISGLSANPYLYTTVKVVILSALSGVLSEILGFKLKLHKIKIK